jgi:hypothetical protein
MTKEDDRSPQHLTWLVRNRSANQKISLRLYKLLQAHPEKLKLTKNSVTAQNLIAATFSLWRAVFLSDKTGARGASLQDASAFLGKLIISNMINFSEDRAAREWTFNYYISDARYRLKKIAEDWKYELSPLAGKQSPKSRWDHCHGELVRAVDLFTKHLRKKDKTPN